MNVTAICRGASLLLVAMLICAATSCNSHPPAEEPASDPQTTAQYVAQADQLYSQRGDLMKLREGIVLLRQARTADPGDYEAAWRLAKFNYYLATHTDNNNERDKA